ncbi:MAG: PilN domain-containing protein, partial [Actinomycetota bacterium]
VVLAGCAVLGVIALFYVLQIFRLSSANSDLEAQQARNAQLSAQIASLNQYADLQQELKEKQGVLDGILANQYLWSTALNDVSRVIPDDAALSAFDGQITSVTGTPAGGTTTTVTGTNPDVVGQITFSGTALDIRTIATWLNQLESVKGWIQAQVSSITQQSGDIYTFDTTIQITKDALAPPKSTGATP